MRSWFFPLLLSAANLGLALAGLSTHDLWLDEVMTLDVATSSFPEMVNFFTSVVPQNPVYYLVTGGAVMLFGDSAVALRMPAVLFGCATVPVLYLLTREVFDEWTARVATVLLAVSPYWLYYEQEARMYTLLGFLVVAQTLCYVRWRRENSRRYLWGYVLSGIVGVYTHVFFLFVPLAHLVHRLCSAGTKPTQALKELGVPLTAIYGSFLPWAMLIVTHFPEGQTWKGWEHVVFGVPYTLLRFSVGYSILQPNYGWKDRVASLVAHDAMVLIAAAVGFGVLLFFGVMEAMRRKADGGTLVLAGFGVPVGLAVTLSLVVIVIGERYLIVTFPFFLLLLALGLRHLLYGPRMLRWLGILMGLLLVFVWGSALRAYHFDDSFGKQSWSSAVRFVAERASDEEPVYFCPRHARHPFSYYSSRLLDSETLVLRTDWPGTAPSGPPSQFWVVIRESGERLRCLDGLVGDYVVTQERLFPKMTGIRVQRFEQSSD